MCIEQLEYVLRHFLESMVLKVIGPSFDNNDMIRMIFPTIMWLST